MLNANWGPGPVNTHWGPGLVNTNCGPGPGARARAGGQKRATGREIEMPINVTLRITQIVHDNCEILTKESIPGTSLQLCQTVKIKLFAKIVNSFQPLTIFVKCFVLDVLQGSESTSYWNTFMPLISFFTPPALAKIALLMIDVIKAINDIPNKIQPMENNLPSSVSG